MLDYFFSRAFRSFKYALSVGGAISCAVVIILGGLGIQTVIIPICGGIALIPIGFIFYENTKVIRDMENLVIKFKDDVKNLTKTNQKLNTNVEELGGEITELKETKDLLMDETIKLEDLLKQAKGKVETLTSLATQYESSIGDLNKNLQKSEKTNEELRVNAEELVRIKSIYEEENNRLQENVDEISVQIEAVSQAKEEYKSQLELLKQNNKDLMVTSELLKTELNNINISYEEAKDVIETLLRSKKVLNDIYDGMAKTEEKTEENVGMMSKLLNMFGVQRSKELFNVLDTDGNQLLTPEEFIDGILNNN